MIIMSVMSNKKYDIEAIMHPIICTHHRLRSRNGKTLLSRDRYETPERIWWHNHSRHNQGKYDKDGKYWCFRFEEWQIYLSESHIKRTSRAIWCMCNSTELIQTSLVKSQTCLDNMSPWANNRIDLTYYILQYVAVANWAIKYAHFTRFQ